MKLIGEILQDLGVPKEKVDEALRIQEEKPNYGRLGEILIKMGVINHVILAKALSAQFGIELKEKINKEEVLDEVTKIFPPYILKDSGFIVLKEPNSEYVSIVLSDPEKSYLISDLQKKFKKVLKLFIAPSDEIERVINEIYGFGDTMEVSREVEKAEEIFSSDEIIETTRDILEEKGEAPIIRFVNALFFQAVKRRASDIHIEPAETETVVRMRIDGVLHEVIRVNKVLHEPIVSRVKVISRLDIAEKRLPQDGKIKLKVAGKDIDVRVSTLPTVFGERVSLRKL